MNGELKLEGLLENFDAIHCGRYKYHDYEIETTEGEFILVNVEVDVNEMHTKPFYTMTYDVSVECYDDYFTLDRWGEEKECILDDEEIKAIEKEITKSIEDKLK